MIVLKIFDKLSLVISSTKITANTPKAQNNKWNDNDLINHVIAFMAEWLAELLAH